MKKPFYKRPIFLIILVIVAVVLVKSAVSGKSSRSTGQNDSPNNAQPSQTERTRPTTRDTEKAPAPDKEANTEATDREVPASAVTSEKPQEDTGTNDNSLIRPEVKEAIDSYEAFVDEYCSFMASYDATNTETMAEYISLMAKELEMTKEFEEIADWDLTEAEMDYYALVALRCDQKLLEASSKMN